MNLRHDFLLILYSLQHIPPLSGTTGNQAVEKMFLFFKFFWKRNIPNLQCKFQQALQNSMDILNEFTSVWKTCMYTDK